MIARAFTSSEELSSTRPRANQYGARWSPSRLCMTPFYPGGKEFSGNGRSAIFHTDGYVRPWVPRPLPASDQAGSRLYCRSGSGSAGYLCNALNHRSVSSRKSAATCFRQFPSSVLLNLSPTPVLRALNGTSIESVDHIAKSTSLMYSVFTALGLIHSVTSIPFLLVFTPVGTTR